MGAQPWSADERAGSPKKDKQPHGGGSWFGRKAAPVPVAKLTGVIDGLKDVYFKKVPPVHSPGVRQVCPC